MELWIPVTLFAAVMQTARTGLQKSLIKPLGDYAVTWMRFVLALPLAPLYLFILWKSGAELPKPNALFAAHAAAAGVMQIISTLILVRLFSLRNFAVCTAFSKTEAVQIALWGTLLFGLPMSAIEAAGVLLGGLGIFLLIPRGGGGKTTLAGMAAGGGFALTALFARQATLSLDGAPFESAAVTLFMMLCLQSTLLTILWYRHLNFVRLWQMRGRVITVGVLSFLGSAGWLSAFALAHPALVKTLAQVELPLAWLLGRAAFAEKPGYAEIAGMTACALAAMVVAFV